MRHRMRRRRGRLLLLSCLTLAFAGLLAPVAFAAPGDPPRVPSHHYLLPLARITAPAGAGHGSLVDSSTGRPFVPRGNNYVRLAPATYLPGAYYHSTFEPGQYDAARADAALADMHANGYNVVRVFIDPGDPRSVAAGVPHGLGRGTADDTDGYGPYYDDVADFVRRAAAYQLYVLPAMDAYPQSQYYWNIRGNYDPDQLNVGGSNAQYLVPGEIAAKKAYLASFVTELRSRLGAPLMTTFLALETDNEATWQADQKPFSSTSGTVTGSDGVVYDLSWAASRQLAADASMVQYANELVGAVHAVDPDLLVTTGMFTYRAVGKAVDGFATHCASGCDGGEWRYPARPASLSAFSTLSFLDLHLYPQAGSYTVAADLASSEWSLVRGTVIVGEYGAVKDVYQGDIVAAAYAMRNLQVTTCQDGFAGWLFWTFDTTDSPGQRSLFTLQDTRGAINGVLAPIVRPDPCQT
jgi:hypothetical protein